MGAGKEADGSGLARQTLSSPRTAQATVCLEGRERETGRGGGSQREVVAKTALPTLQFCQGPPADARPASKNHLPCCRQ